MLTTPQRIAVGLSLLGTVAVILLVVLFARRPVPTLPVTPIASKFDPAAAIENTRVLAEEYPDRITGSEGARRAAEYLRTEFRNRGYQVTDNTFTMWLRGQRVEGHNVIAEIPGQTSESVAVIAHYDGQTTSHQAAEDNASGVGVMLELARVLRDQPRHRGLIFVATDAEEWGMIGARALTGFFHSQSTTAVISIDYLNRGRAPALGIDCGGQLGGYTPLWLRQLLVEAGEAQRVEVAEPGAAWEWVERALEVSAQDQGPLVRAGIPALNISTLTKGYAASRRRYHSTEDVFRDFDPQSFRMLGATVEQAVDALDRLPQIESSMNYWRLSRKSYLPDGIVRLIQLLGLVPILLAGLFAAVNFEKDRPPQAAVALVRPLVYLIPALLALVTLYALTATDILPRWELYPATPKDPFLYQIPISVAAALALAFLAGYRILRWLKTRLAEPPSYSGKKRVLYLWLCVAVLCSFLLNPYAMWLFLGLFAYMARLLHPPRKPALRAADAFMLFVSAVPFVAVLYRFGAEIFLGWRILWYLVLQTAYHVWSPMAAVVFLLSTVLWILLFRISVFGKLSGMRPAGVGHGVKPEIRNWKAESEKERQGSRP